MGMGIILGFLWAVTTMLLIVSAISQFSVVTRWPTLILYVIALLLTWRSPARSAFLWFAAIPSVLLLGWAVLWVVEHVAR